MNDNLLPTGAPLAPGWMDFFIVLGTILLVALGVLFWAIVFRKRVDKSGHNQQRHHHRHHRHRKHSTFRDDLQKTTAGIKEIIEKGKQQHHHHRHEHRPMNPTLAQTGGLPPVREESKPPPPP